MFHSFTLADSIKEPFSYNMQGCYYFSAEDDATFFAGPMYDDSESWGINRKSGTSLEASAADRQYSIFNINRHGRLKVGGGHTDISASHTPELVVGNGSGNAAMSLFAGSSSYAYIFFSDASSGSGADTGYIRYNFSDDTVYTNRAWCQASPTKRGQASPRPPTSH